MQPYEANNKAKELKRVDCQGLPCDAKEGKPLFSLKKKKNFVYKMHCFMRKIYKTNTSLGFNSVKSKR